ncbi:hypothetical protein [Arthrobacter sp.]|uniref:sunset domain-containing protein n=1 Tax=Arthrobacter sp. TaxID=1667 RepID=UPI003A95AE17
MKTTFCRAMAVMAAASSLVLGGTVAASAAPVAPSTVTPFAVQGSVPAATTSKVTLGTISSPIVRVGGTATVAPQAKTSGAVDIRSKAITVVRGKKTLVRSKSSARLKAGTYSVTSVVKYRSISGTGASKKYSSTKTISKKQKLVVRSAVAIKGIAGKTAPYRGKATIKPNVSRASGVSLSSTRLTVKQGSKKVASNKTSAALKAGTYRVTTTAKYRIPLYKTSTVKATSKRLVAGPDTPARMNCKVTKIGPEENYYYYFPTRELTLKCTGAFSGSYTTMADYALDSPEARDLGIAGQSNWWDNEDSATKVNPVVGATASPYLFPQRNLYTSVTTSKKVTKKSWSPTYSTTKTQTVRIKAGKKPNHVDGTGGYKCPAGFPIKGNASSMIYHVPGGAFYSRTTPEECFSSTAAARSHGYRASRR